jgi:hypothetical protein
MMEYFQNDMLSYYTDRTGRVVYKVLFQYASDKDENKAALNFHLSAREKKDIMYSIGSSDNVASEKRLMGLFEKAKKGE